ncbi:hypothetical protein [Methylobacterium flocculans]|uniref:hypothetical protein n=1 Tax=Methylobacterium flocculans TaxID=2984843 RepID=UPI0021F25CEE|nr:hypothetical protein [Methylobacterium sp. FF17]
MNWYRRLRPGPTQVRRGVPTQACSSSTKDELRRRALLAARRRLSELRDAGEICDAAVSAVEADLRRIELRAFLGNLYPN